MDIYITKYALTKGIIRAREEALESGADCQWLVGKSKVEYLNYYNASDWCVGLSNAKAQAEQRRERKINSLRKQLHKLEDMDIQIHE
jgi:hypothetical protein